MNKRNALLGLVVLVFAMGFSQKTTIKGTILDEKSIPITGASVIEKGTKNGVVTDDEGRFSIGVSGSDSVLSLTYMGYKTQEVVVIDGMQVSLEPELSKLDEVVIVGYGTQKKVNLTGSLVSVSGKDIQGVPANSVTSMIQGRMPGVTVTQKSGQPGKESTSIRIRGLGTMNNADPMVIVDGLETNMNDVNPADIETFTVLKDAAAASIYGTRAANGVILITTKRGQIGSPKLTYSGYVGVQNAFNTPKQLSSYNYAQLLNEGLMNEGKSPKYTPAEIEAFKNGTAPNTDWIKLLLQGTGITYNHAFNLTGGTEKTKYMVSMGYYNQEGLMKNSNTDRFNTRINLDSKITPWLNFGISSAASRQKIVQPANPYTGTGTGQFFRQANLIPNTLRSTDDNGKFIKSHTDGNPIAWAENGGSSSTYNTHLIGNSFLEIKPLEGLSIKGLGGVDYTIGDERTHVKVVDYVGVPPQGPNRKRDSLGRSLVTTLQLTATYIKEIADHDFSILLGAARQANERYTTTAFRQNFPTNDVTDLDAGSQNGMSANGSSDEVRLGSYFGRINYSYAKRYLLEVNTRYDASSKFAIANRAAVFPSFSLGWRVSEEKFMKPLTWLSDLKVRGSWGKLGNHQIDSYQYTTNYAPGQLYPFGSASADGLAQNIASNPNIRWEKTTEWDIGLDVSIKNDLLGLVVDYYDRFTDDILVVLPVSATYGLKAPLSNGGAMRNKGIEIKLEHGHRVGDFTYNLAVYGTYNVSNVERFPNPSLGNTVQKEGAPWNAYYGYVNIGKFQTDEEAKTLPNRGANEKAGDLRYQDLDGDGKITPTGDRTVIGTELPKATYGVNMNMTYKQFDLSLFFQGVADVYRTIGELMWGFGNAANNAVARNLSRTIVENERVTTEGYYPRILPNNYGINSSTSTFTVMRSDYLRLKNIQVGYSLPQSLIGKFVSRMRFYVSAQNLLTLTNFTTDVDPESTSGSYAYPQVKFYNVGLDVTF